jgi:hypothetical protein
MIYEFLSLNSAKNTRPRRYDSSGAGADADATANFYAIFWGLCFPVMVPCSSNATRDCAGPVNACWERGLFPGRA